MGEPVFQLEAHFGDEAAREFRTALRSMHAFAQRTGCPAGNDVIQWIAVKNHELQNLVRAEFEANHANSHQHEDKANG